MEPAPPPVEQHITFLYTPDLERATRFYEQVLGLKLALDQGGCRIYRICGESFLGLCQRDEARQNEGVIVTLVSQEVDAWHERLVAHGTPVEKAPALNPKYGIYHLFARDPDGTLLEIQRFEDPAWPAPA